MLNKGNGTHRKDEPIEEHGREVHWPRPASEVKVRRLEGVRGEREAQERDEPVGRDGRHASSRYERRERDLARQDGAQKHGGKDEHDRHRVPRLPVRVHLSYPAREREHAVTRDGKDESRGGHHGYASILEREHERDVSVRGEKTDKWTTAHHDETERSDDGHEDARTFTEGERIHLHERLRGIEREERVQVRDTEQKQDGRDEAEHAGGDRAREDTPAGNDAVKGDKKVGMREEARQGTDGKYALGVLRFFGDMARGIEAG